MIISQASARHLMLAAQGLDQPPAAPATKASVLGTIRQMGALQIDTIHIVARSPYLVLFSRLGDYNPRWLDELLAEGEIFEYWSHAACFLPREDYPYYRRRMLEARDGWYNPKKWIQDHPEVVARVMGRIRESGPVRSADFENENHQGGGWWSWKEEKEALECLFTLGELMIARREKFQRLYDLRQRVRPDWEDAHLPAADEVRRALTLKAVRAMGITTTAWVPDYFRMPKSGLRKLIEGLAEEGFLEQVEVEGWAEPAYVHRDNLPLFEQAAAGAIQPTLTTLLSPFDPLIWDRARLKTAFGFDYSLECYLPAHKRKYGYFSLPILHRGRLIGRLDPKAHRKEGIFEVKAIYLEPGVDVDEGLVTDLSAALGSLAAWHGTPKLIIRQSEPEGLGESLLLTLNRDAEETG